MKVEDAEAEGPIARKKTRQPVELSNIVRVGRKCVAWTKSSVLVQVLSFQIRYVYSNSKYSALRNDLLFASKVEEVSSENMSSDHVAISMARRPIVVVFVRSHLECRRSVTHVSSTIELWQRVMTPHFGCFVTAGQFCIDVISDMPVLAAFDFFVQTCIPFESS